MKLIVVAYSGPPHEVSLYESSQLSGRLHTKHPTAITAPQPLRLVQPSCGLRNVRARTQIRFSSAVVDGPARRSDVQDDDPCDELADVACNVNCIVTDDWSSSSHSSLSPQAGGAVTDTCIGVAMLVCHDL